MALESGDFISDLDETWPLGSDNVSQGDDHVRLIKHILKTQFPNLDSAVTATPEEMNKGGTPTGAVIAFGGAVAPSGYLLCNGDEIDRTTYAGLYAVITDTYGAGDGSTTFNIPDLRSAVPAGADGTNAQGDVGGKDTWTSADIPSHGHTTSTNGNHTHNYGFSEFDFDRGDLTTKYAQSRLDPNSRTTTTNGNHSHTVNNTGSGGDNRQATLYVNYIIKV